MMWIDPSEASLSKEVMAGEQVLLLVNGGRYRPKSGGEQWVTVGFWNPEENNWEYPWWNYDDLEWTSVNEDIGNRDWVEQHGGFGVVLGFSLLSSLNS